MPRAYNYRWVSLEKDCFYFNFLELQTRETPKQNIRFLCCFNGFRAVKNHLGACDVTADSRTFRSFWRVFLGVKL